MRRLACLLLAIVGACNLPLGGDTSTGTTGDAGAQCLQTNGCENECTTCALQGPCASLWATCESDPDCQAIDGCWGGCGSDTSCQQTCLANNPNGESDYLAVNQCVYCQQCPTACVGQCMQ